MSRTVLQSVREENPGTSTGLPCSAEAVYGKFALSKIFQEFHSRCFRVGYGADTLMITCYLLTLFMDDMGETLYCFVSVRMGWKLWVNLSSVYLLLWIPSFPWVVLPFS